MIEEGLLLAGRDAPAIGGGTFPVLCPADETELGRCAGGSAEDIAAAVEAARGGFDEWAAMAPAQREAVLLRAAEIIAAEGEQRAIGIQVGEGADKHPAMCDSSPYDRVQRDGGGRCVS